MTSLFAFEQKEKNEQNDYFSNLKKKAFEEINLPDIIELLAKKAELDLREKNLIEREEKIKLHIKSNNPIINKSINNTEELLKFKKQANETKKIYEANIDELLKIDIKYENVVDKKKHTSRRYNHRSRKIILSDTEKFELNIKNLNDMCDKIESEIKKLNDLLENFNKGNEQLEKHLQSLNELIAEKTNKLNNTENKNWREKLLTEHNLKKEIETKKSEITKITEKKNLIDQKIIKINKYIGKYIQDKKECEKAISDLKEREKDKIELNPIVQIFNEQMPDLNLSCKITSIGTDCNCQQTSFNQSFESQKLRINANTARLIKYEQIDQLLLHYNLLKKSLSNNFNTGSIEQVCCNFASKYGITQLINTGYKEFDGLYRCKPEYDILFLHFHWVKQIPYNDNTKQAFENTIKLLKIFSDLIIFIRPDVEELVKNNTIL